MPGGAAWWGVGLPGGGEGLRNWEKKNGGTLLKWEVRVVQVRCCIKTRVLL